MDDITAETDDDSDDNSGEPHGLSSLPLFSSLTKFIDIYVKQHRIINLYALFPWVILDYFGLNFLV